MMNHTVREGIIIGLGDSFMAGDEAGGSEKSYLKRIADARGYDDFNLGKVGMGNLGAANMLLVNTPEWISEYNKKYLIWSPSGLNRIDVPIPSCLSKDTQWLPLGDDRIPTDYFPVTLFPGKACFSGNLTYLNPICEAIFPLTSDSTGVINFFISWKMIDMWCKTYGFEYVIFPAFRDDMTYLRLVDRYKEANLFKQLPWHKFIKVEDCTSYLQWAFVQAGIDKNMDMQELINRRDSLNLTDEKKTLLDLWIAPRGHVTEYGTEKFAQILNNFLPF